MRIILLALFLSISNYILAQNACSSGRYYSEVFTATQSTRNIKFGEADPFGLINNQDLYLDIIEPVGDTLSKRPLVLHQFGGGFLIGWRTEPVIPQMAEMYAKRGFVFATIDYRLGFNPLDGQSAERAVYRGALDLAASLRFLVDNADTYGIDTSAIFITGTSAGCISGLVNVFMKDNDRVDIPSTYGILLEPDDLGCINCVGNNNFNNQKVRVHGVINNWGAMLDTSYIDIQADSEDNVPVISFHGTDDDIVPYVEGPPFSLPIFPNMQGSLLIHQRLDNQGIKNRLFPLQGLGHEPQLLQLQTWVTDTIIRQGSLFLYEIMYGDSIAINGDPTVCFNDVQSYSLPLHAGSSYCWDVNGGNIQSITNNTITIEWNTIGSFELKGYELDRREISKEAILNVIVETSTLPSVSFSSFNGLFDFSSSSTANTYLWDFGNGNTGSGANVSNLYTDSGFYLVNLLIENDYCSSTIDTLIESTICPVADFSFTQNDSLFTFTSNAQFASNSYWITNDGSILTTPTFDLNFTAEGNYGLTLIATNDFCSDTFSLILPINFCSSANFDYLTDELDVDFTDLSYNAYFYNWDFGDGAISALENPTHTYTNPGTYTVSLATASISSCLDTIEKTITVDIANSISSSDESAIQIYPNPFDSDIKLLGLDKNKKYSYKIFSIEGKLIEFNSINRNVIPTSKMESGLYLIEIELEDQAIFHQLLVKK